MQLSGDANITMQENLCLQCKKVSAGPTNRLVQDSCGHKKCRVCLLEDEEKCRQCEASSSGTNGEVSIKENQNELETEENGDVPPTEVKEFVINNHTAVIKLNGNVSTIAKAANKEDIKVNDGEHVVAVQETSHAEVGVADEKAAKTETKKTPIKSKKGGKKKRAYNAIDIPKHITIMSDPLSYNCGICKKSFVTKAHVKYHIYCARGNFWMRKKYIFTFEITPTVNYFLVVV